MIKVYDVTEFQQQLLDYMWTLETKEEVEAWAR